jgi:hypothetical protein
MNGGNCGNGGEASISISYRRWISNINNIKAILHLLVLLCLGIICFKLASGGRPPLPLIALDYNSDTPTSNTSNSQGTGRAVVQHPLYFE